MSGRLSNSIWTPQLTRVVTGIQRINALENPAYKKVKFPFGLHMINVAFTNLLNSGATFPERAMHASLCMGFMFLFRKSEFLTDSSGRPKLRGSIPMTLSSDDTFLWYGDTSYSANCTDIPKLVPDFISMFLPFTKGDQFGKGATRFFPCDKENPNCLVKVVHAYLLEAKLKPGQSLFASDAFMVSHDAIAKLMKATAVFCNIPADRVSCHSLRIGGLVTLFAADVPDSLKQLAGRWSSEKSFIMYARATMTQYETIASALNNPNLVTADHMKRFYL